MVKLGIEMFLKKEITPQEWMLLKSRNCNKEKHRIRTNEFGVTFCVICGRLGTGFADKLKDNECLTIKNL